MQNVSGKETWAEFSYPAASTKQTPAGRHDNQERKSIGTVPAQAARAQLALINRIHPFSTTTSLLDIACGPGTVFTELFDSFSLPTTATLTGIDISQPMLRQLEQRRQSALTADAASPWARVKAYKADACNLETVPSASQSHVISALGIFAVPDSDAALREARRVMAPDGVFSMTGFKSAVWVDEILPQLTELFPERRVPRSPEKWCTSEAFAAELERNGFRDVVVEAIDVAFFFADAERVVDEVWKALPFMPMVTKGMSDEEKDAAKRAMVEYTKTHFPDGKLTGVINVAVGR